MFKNIGEKLKRLACFSCWVGIVGSVIGGIGLIIYGLILFGLLTAVLGSLCSWISSWLTYAIGEIAENTNAIRKATNLNDAIWDKEKKEAERKQILTVFKSTSKNPSTLHYCPHCGEVVTSRNCDMCGKENNLF